MWNTSIKLPNTCEQKKDSEGFSETTYQYIEGIPANIRDSTRQDEIVADKYGYRADKIAEIMACNYSSQSHLIDESDGCFYEIKRSFIPDKSMYVFLTLERRENVSV